MEGNEIGTVGPESHKEYKVKKGTAERKNQVSFSKQVVPNRDTSDTLLIRIKPMRFCIILKDQVFIGLYEPDLTLFKISLQKLASLKLTFPFRLF